MTSKILALTDALGNLVRFVLLPGNCADISGVRELLAGQKFGYLLADRGFDADWLRRELASIKATSVIPGRRHRRQPVNIDWHLYQGRHLIENFFCKLREFRGTATRSCKTDSSFAAFICIVSTLINAR